MDVISPCDANVFPVYLHKRSSIPFLFRLERVQLLRKGSKTLFEKQNKEIIAGRSIICIKLCYEFGLL